MLRYGKLFRTVKCNREGLDSDNKLQSKFILDELDYEPYLSWSDFKVGLRFTWVIDKIYFYISIISTWWNVKLRNFRYLSIQRFDINTHPHKFTNRNSNFKEQIHKLWFIFDQSLAQKCYHVILLKQKQHYIFIFPFRLCFTLSEKNRTITIPDSNASTFLHKRYNKRYGKWWS